ncbi:MAG: hypothetical protein Unbinned2990contig1002_12 [Prokaryotic dsDNA virus sp.]|nr:MAG: hypothetical protein Unbinned2990contig1002_12 [Prokaryotic dsDNA virus sp.]|tara:strand:- start:739 stop:1836 length:1098 start_codon:yes stop_codon:yes gene_type:complete
MAKQNVGNPKFYIDMLSFFKAQGSFEDTYGDTKLMGELNPVESIQETAEAGFQDLSGYREYRVKLDHDNRMSGATHIPSFKHWLGFFNHNFYDSKIKNTIINVLNVAEQGVNNITASDFSEICNFPMDSTTTFQQNGWSMAECDPIAQSFRTLSISTRTDSTTNFELMLSKIGFGQVFQMPHSPDLKLTIRREYDGIKKQQTKGGSTLTQVDYTGSPHWGTMPAWYVGQANLSTQEGNNYKEKRQYGRGRRIWDLKFSYISDWRLFPINESISRNNPTDSIDLEDNSSYINANNDFTTDAYDSYSFMTVVMGKTLGGSLPFIFQPDGNNNSPDQFAICQIDQSSFNYEQVANGVYDISLTIREVW